MQSGREEGSFSFPVRLVLRLLCEPGGYAQGEAARLGLENPCRRPKRQNPVRLLLPSLNSFSDTQMLYFILML